MEVPTDEIRTASGTMTGTQRRIVLTMLAGTLVFTGALNPGIANGLAPDYWESLALGAHAAVLSLSAIWAALGREPVPRMNGSSLLAVAAYGKRMSRSQEIPLIYQ